MYKIPSAILNIVKDIFTLNIRTTCLMINGKSMKIYVITTREVLEYHCADIAATFYMSVLSYDHVDMQWIKSCHVYRMITRVITLWCE